jgi:hypothetical protein
VLPVDVIREMKWIAPVIQIIRPGRGLKSTIFRVSVDVDDFKEIFCVKVHSDERQFINEKKVYDLRLSGGLVPSLKKSVKTDTSFCLIVQPFALDSLQHAEFDLSVFRAACRSGAKVMTQLRDNNIGYGDISPDNVFVIEPSAGVSCVWNDFSHCVDLGQVMSQVYGKSGYCSRDILALEYDSETAHKYNTVDDLESMFLTLLEFAWTDDHSTRMLPWIRTGNFHQRVHMLSSDKVESMLLNHVHSDCKETLRQLHKNVFVDKNIDAAIATMAQVEDERKAVTHEAAVASIDGVWANEVFVSRLGIVFPQDRRGCFAKPWCSVQHGLKHGSLVLRGWDKPPLTCGCELCAE